MIFKNCKKVVNLIVNRHLGSCKGEVPKIKFNNGNEYPMLGLGTWKSSSTQVIQAVKDAIDIGYRHIDGAHVYQNEREVGLAVKAKLKEGVMKRCDYYHTSKLWCTHHRPECVESALLTTLGNLGLEYIDLYLIHWPISFKKGNNLFPMGPRGALILDCVDYVCTWKEMEKLYKIGLAKNIGVANFTRGQIERLLTECTVVPVTNQIECTPYLNQSKMISFCKHRGITVTSYSPLGSPDRPNISATDPVLLEDPTFKAIGERYGKTPAQILLRYQIQRGVATIPKSVTKSRIEENFNIFDFKIADDDMDLLNSLDCNGRTCTFDLAKHAEEYPFAPGIEY